MEHVELVIFGLLLGVAALAVLARIVGVPYPITLVLGGTVIGFIPGVPSVELDPDLVLLIFLPPLLYGAAFFTSLRDLRRNARAIALLAIPLVGVTMVAVAVVAHEVIGLGWGESFVLGAIVSPTDAVAPAEIMRRIGAPRRLVTVVEGENLTNDWTALVLYRLAVAAVVTGSFSLVEATGEFVLTGVGGLVIGLAAGWVIREVRSRIDDPPTEITISIAERLCRLSAGRGAGLFGRDRGGHRRGLHGLAHAAADHSDHADPGHVVWEILTFLLNAVLFLLVGMQLPTVLDNITGYSAGELIFWGILISLVVIVRAPDVGFHGDLPDPGDRPASRPARTACRLAGAPGDRLGWDAGVRVAGRGPGAAPPDGRRRGLPGSGPDHPAGVHRDPGDAGGAGPHPRAAHRAARGHRRRLRGARGGRWPASAWRRPRWRESRS